MKKILAIATALAVPVPALAVSPDIALVPIDGGIKSIASADADSVVLADAGAAFVLVPTRTPERFVQSEPLVVTPPAPGPVVRSRPATRRDTTYRVRTRVFRVPKYQIGVYY